MRQALNQGFRLRAIHQATTRCPQWGWMCKWKFRSRYVCVCVCEELYKFHALSSLNAKHVHAHARPPHTQYLFREYLFIRLNTPAHKQTHATARTCDPNSFRWIICPNKLNTVFTIQSASLSCPRKPGFHIQNYIFFVAQTRNHPFPFDTMRLPFFQIIAHKCDINCGFFFHNKVCERRSSQQ